jgi:hypothetical protein
MAPYPSSSVAGSGLRGFGSRPQSQKLDDLNETRQEFSLGSRSAIAARFADNEWEFSLKQPLRARWGIGADLLPDAVHIGCSFQIYPPTRPLAVRPSLGKRNQLKGTQWAQSKRVHLNF